MQAAPHKGQGKGAMPWLAQVALVPQCLAWHHRDVANNIANHANSSSIEIALCILLTISGFGCVTMIMLNLQLLSEGGCMRPAKKVGSIPSLKKRGLRINQGENP